MRSLTLVFLLALSLVVRSDDSFPGDVSQWHGFKRHDFEFKGRKGIIVQPQQAADQKPWIWRARFFGHEPQLDLALLNRGFHLAYIDTVDLFGSPSAVGIWNSYYHFLVGEKGLHAKPILEGMSRGGLMIYNWAVQNPTRVSGIYADAPVLDFRSWPGGGRRFSHPGQQEAWTKLLNAYGFESDQQALEYRGNPVDQIRPLIDQEVPLFHVCGEADQVVAYSDNTGRFKHRYQQLGGRWFQEIVKPQGGHHPHSLPDPGPLVEFVLTCLKAPSP